MRAYSSMPVELFIDAVREAAIRGNAPATTIGLIDSLYDLAENESDLEAAEEARDEMEAQRDALADLLREMLDNLPDNAGEMLENVGFDKIAAKAEEALTEICK